MSDRDCKNCKHNKPDGCSRWECEYVPRTDALISRQDAIDECDKQYPNIDRQDFKAVINAVPSADAVEVVRCKDCKHCRWDGFASKICRLTDMTVEDECYCWWGERMVKHEID